MKLQNVKIVQENNTISATYEFLLEYEKTKRSFKNSFPMRIFQRKKDLENAEKQIMLFEELVDSLYEGPYSHKTKNRGKYVEMIATNRRGIPPRTKEECQKTTTQPNSLCSSIYYDGKHRAYKKPMITVTNKGTYLEKINEFNKKIQEMPVQKSTKAITKMKELEQIIKQYN